MVLSVRLPRQRVWPILPGARSFLNCEAGLEGQLKRDSEIGDGGVERELYLPWRGSLALGRGCECPL